MAVFVDAGYLFKQGSSATLGEKLGRHELQLDAPRFVDEVGRWLCDRYPSDKLLRTYWYDGAKRGVPSAEQLEIAALPFVKFRLGRINAAGQQKGVDTLMVRDLMVLSQERSIRRAVVLSGDEDLREGIEYVQDRGVSVAVVGIDADGDRNQSIELVREADEHLVLPTQTLVACVRRRGSQSTPSVPAQGSSTAGPVASSQDGYQTCAETFARRWLANATEGEVAALVAGKPKIPRELDAQMLQEATGGPGGHTISDSDRRSMRREFWQTVTHTAEG